MPVSKKPRKVMHGGKSQVAKQAAFMKMMGGKAMEHRMRETYRALQNGDVDFNFGLPPITDKEGPAEC